MKKQIAVAGTLLLGALVVPAKTTNLTAQADVDIRSTPASENIGYDRNVLIIGNRNVDPAVAQAAKAYIRFQLPPDFGTATSATFTMTRTVVRTANYIYNVYGLDQGPIPGSMWDELTWPEVNTGTPTTATTWNNAPGNVASSPWDFTSSASLLATFQVTSSANGGVVGDQWSITGENLVNFINADTNGFVTLLVSRPGLSSAEDQWASAEHSTYPGPVLTIQYESSTDVPARIAGQPQPASQTVYETQNAIFTASVSGTQPLTNRWRLNGVDLVDGPNVSGANSTTLVLRNVTAEMTGAYTLSVTNAFGDATSSNAMLVVNPANIFFNSGQMTNIWNLVPGERPYLHTLDTERGLAYNPLTGNLYVASSASNTVSGWVAVLDAQTGADKYYLNTVGVWPGVGSSSMALNLVGVGSDGAVYGAGQVINAKNYIYYIYKWQDDNEFSSPFQVFLGDPSPSLEPGLRWGDNFAVRGAGADTQILIAPSNATNSFVVLLRTVSGTDFSEIPPAVIPITGLPDGAAPSFAARGLVFGPGTNTFWAKALGGRLYLVEFDIDALNGTVLHTYPTSQVPGNLVGISVDEDQQFLAGVANNSAGQNVQLYEVSDLVSGPRLLHQGFYPNQPAGVTSPGWAATTFGNDCLFALDANYGIKAFQINTSWTPVSVFPISSVVKQNGALVLAWPTSPGHTYQVQSQASLSGGAWSNLGSPISASGSTASFTNEITSETALFYRIQGL